MTESTVIMRLAGPMQAWSTKPRGALRPTQDHPTKSGVVGLVANALGRDRTDPIDDLATLTFAVRGDRRGLREHDYHTIGNGEMPMLPRNIIRNPRWLRAAGRIPEGKRPTRAAIGAVYTAPREVTEQSGVLVAKPGNTIITIDAYLADAIFTVALTGDAHLITQVGDALQRPARVLHLGRVGYPTTDPVFIATTAATTPSDALRTCPRAPRADDGHLSLWEETAPNNGATVVFDQPRSYATRVCTARGERRIHIDPPPAHGHHHTPTPDFFTAPPMEEA